MFGYKKALPVEERPIYGYLREAGKVDGNAAWYGDALMDLKPAVRQRTTAVWTDSLGSLEQPSPITRVRATSYNPRGTIDPATGKVTGRMPRPGATGRPYTEAQMHGGVTADDILRVTFEQRPSFETEAALKAAGFERVPSDPSQFLHVWERVGP